MRFSVILIAAAMSAHPVLAEDSYHERAHASPYAGQQTRDIKALSRDDSEELLPGGGWGLAKVAELNGMLGPIHILDVAASLGLSSEQSAKVTLIRTEMRTRAVALGRRFVAKEAELGASFRKGDIALEELNRILKEIEMARAELRVVHLAAHIEFSRILTRAQVVRYGRLRVYR